MKGKNKVCKIFKNFNSLGMSFSYFVDPLSLAVLRNNVSKSLALNENEDCLPKSDTICPALNLSKVIVSLQ